MIVLNPKDRRSIVRVASIQKPHDVKIHNRIDLFGGEVSDFEIDVVIALVALKPEVSFKVWTRRPECAEKYLSEFIESDFSEGARSERTTLAVNEVMKMKGRGWGYFGDTGTAITTTSRNNLGREPGMLVRHKDGGVSRLCFHGDGELLLRCSDEFAARVPKWAACNDGEFGGWSLKYWPLHNLEIQEQSK